MKTSFSKSIVGVTIDRGCVVVVFANCLLRVESIGNVLRITSEPRVKVYSQSFN